jgi:hypothetical protein
MKKNIFVLLIALFCLKINCQNNYLGFLAGYTYSSAGVSNDNFSISSNGFSRGQNFLDFTSGFQFGLQVNIDIGYDFYHLDLSPVYSQYGFNEQQKVSLDYFDLDIGSSNFNSRVFSKFIYGGGITPSFLISSRNIENVKDFDLRVYLKVGYKISRKLVLYSQFRYGFLDLVSDVNNFQISLNLNYTIFKF